MENNEADSVGTPGGFSQLQVQPNILELNCFQACAGCCLDDGCPPATNLSMVSEKNLDSVAVFELQGVVSWIPQ